MSLNTKLVYADIKVAKYCNSPLVNLFNDEALYSNAAYHAEQATEKCLKLILSNYYGISETEKRYRTHDIPDLLAYMKECEANTGKKVPICIPEIIEINAIEIKEWEANTRYNDNMVVLRSNITSVISACDIMCRQLEKMGC